MPPDNSLETLAPERSVTTTFANWDRKTDKQSSGVAFHQADEPR